MAIETGDLLFQRNMRIYPSTKGTCTWFEVGFPTKESKNHRFCSMFLGEVDMSKLPASDSEKYLLDFSRSRLQDLGYYDVNRIAEMIQTGIDCGDLAPEFLEHWKAIDAALWQEKQ